MIPGRLLVALLALLTLPVTASIDRDPQRLFAPGPAAGKYLVASESLRDPRFRRTVILIVNHDDQGSLGVIINRPSEVPLSEVIDEAGDGRLHIGGPVQTRVYSMLFRSEKGLAAPASDEASDDGAEIMRVFRDIDFVLGYRAVREVYPRLGADDPHRIYAGYTGWSAGQLEDEIEDGGWHLISESPELIFSDDPGGIWEQMMRKLRGHWI